MATPIAGTADLAAALAERLAGEVIASGHPDYGDNHQRLARVKAAYDPDNRFRLNQNIQPQDGAS